MFRMRRFGAVLALAGLLILGAGVIAMMGDGPGRSLRGSVTAQTPSTERVVTVTGEGRVTLPPDSAKIVVGATGQGAELGPVQESVNEKVNAVIDALKKGGVSEKQIRTVSFNISVDRDWNQPTSPITGYTVTHMVEATVKPIGSVSEVLQSAVDAGANLVSDVMFTVEDQEGALRQAREAAMQDARAKAEQLAQFGGVQIGPPVMIQEGVGVAPPPVPYAREAMAMDAAGTALQPGESTLSVTVTVSYAIQ